ncbi:hypothetical protein FEM48_Zijuj06G0018900 [Ziziphus jujuba var. spinosa]|uniref:Uncharacterized protein n=1 Tax=Ziziphus jujuba var. spinosa TaxID=714518 RepID=A0A978V6H3_ZIZJJ|nr:hypothetical protein FEM48_Zijuj06G0018900 [Ziziphus jujuba var. spinosa]
MGTKGWPRVSSERQNWHNIFNAMVQMLRNQKTQLDTLAKERKILEQRLRMQHDNWVSDVRLLEDQISQMKGDFVTQKISGSLEAAKSEFVIGLKEREAFLNKIRLEYADNELDDLKALFNLMSNKLSDQEIGGSDKDIRSLKNTKDGKHLSNRPESEVTRLKQEYEKLALEKNSEVSALLAEKQFVWNQYKIMEDNYTIKLNNKSSEVDAAKGKVQELLASMEQLQSSNNEKDDRIARLTSEVAKMNDESNKLKEETFRLSQELDSLRKFKSASVTPVLKGCTAGTRTSRLRGNNSDGNRIVTVKKESSALQIPDSIKGKGSKSSKRKGDVIFISETPKLFTSSFKVPKLKNSTPHMH